MATEVTAGPLFIIGGHEDKSGEREILSAVAQQVAGGKLVVVTAAAHDPSGYFDSYREGFDGLQVGELVELYLHNRAEASTPATLDLLDGAAGVFFSGGDQLRITSLMANTPLDAAVRNMWRSGRIVAGTSAGASMLADTMMVSGSSDETHRVGNIRMAPGLGYVRDVLIDQHFAERGRIGRLLGAVAHSPRALGIGIDENTAVVARGDTCTVLGTGGVYLVDGQTMTHTTISEEESNRPLSAFDVRLHLLTSGDSFSLSSRTVQAPQR